MREAIGGSQLLLIVVTILIVTMLLLAGSIGYTKAFKARNAILNIVQSNGSYGQDAATFMEKTDAEEEIATLLQDMGYNVKIGSSNGCRKEKEFQSIQGDDSAISSFSCWQSQQYNFSIYTIYDNNGGMHYGIETYMYFELPLFGRTDIFSFPLYAETYNFKKTEHGNDQHPNTSGDDDKNDDNSGTTTNPGQFEGCKFYNTEYCEKLKEANEKTIINKNYTTGTDVIQNFNYKLSDDRKSFTVTVELNPKYTAKTYEFKKGNDDYASSDSKTKNFFDVVMGTTYNVCTRVTTSDETKKVQQSCINVYVKPVSEPVCKQVSGCACNLNSGLLTGDVILECTYPDGTHERKIVSHCTGTCGPR